MNEREPEKIGKNQNIIIKVEKDSIAEEMGIEPGDILVSINDTYIKDVLDYRYLIQDEYINVVIRKPNNEEWELEIEKDDFEDLGIVFESGLMDKAKSCSNKCIFCFIDQNPKGMRKTIYFKDDDSRLSFLQGNYITLTNMKDEDLDRIIFYHLSPINISVHATDTEIRKFMLKNPNSVKIMHQIEKLANANIKMNFQIVLCKDVNDKHILDKSIEDLSKYVHLGCSMAIVPLGVTKYRDNLPQIESFSKEDSLNIIKQVEAWQEKLQKKYGTKFVFLSDEFYLKADINLPNGDYYEGYPQLENGVGMITLMEEEFFEYFNTLKGDNIKRVYSVATAKLAYPLIKKLCDKICEKFSNTKINVYEIRNDFFGKTITVSGLLTGGDIVNQLKDKELGDILFLPENCVRADDTVLLDDMDITDIERELNIKVCLSKDNGADFIKQFIGG
ncbi:DUF512 domain-containing protein [[Clostridium] colinum]|uniref:DUF512 domain-containing protein n=1 Tax=[Clostridium] colinum TaxID=36835 RepID=UPI0020255924|nr:DUF512 domain-containing protein [[Clostridium] colinum]